MRCTNDDDDDADAVIVAANPTVFVVFQLSLRKLAAFDILNFTLLALISCLIHLYSTVCQAACSCHYYQ